MIFVKNSRGGREVNMINTLSKIGWKGGWSTSIWIVSLNILFFFGDYPLMENTGPKKNKSRRMRTLWNHKQQTIHKTYRKQT